MTRERSVFRVAAQFRTLGPREVIHNVDINQKFNSV